MDSSLLIGSIILALFTVALLYAAVGHGGASGYLAVMALAGFSPETLRPTALLLNLIVSLMGTLLFFRSGAFQRRLFFPLVATSIPAAYLGGTLHLAMPYFHFFLAIALAFAALRLVLPPKERNGTASLWGLLGLGACIGFFSGLIGVGGGIFLTPLLILLGWSNPREAAALSAPFIFVNSLGGLFGQSAPWQHLPATLPWMILAVVLGGLLGASWGSGKARLPQLRIVLASVLSMACVKLFII